MAAPPSWSLAADDIKVLHKDWPATGIEAHEAPQRVCNELERYDGWLRSAFADRPYDINHGTCSVESVVRAWIVHRVNWNRTPDRERGSMAELMWQMLAYARLVNYRKFIRVPVESELSVCRLTVDLQNLAAQWHLRPISVAEVDRLFDDCACLVVYVASHGIDRLVANALVNLKDNPEAAQRDRDALDAKDEIKEEEAAFHTDRDLFDAVWRAEQLATKANDKAAEYARTQKLSYDAASVAGEFNSLAARVFFSIQASLLARRSVPVVPFTPPGQSEWKAGQANFRAWLLKEVEFADSDSDGSRWADLHCLLETSLGTKLKLQRGKAANDETFSPQELFRAERSTASLNALNRLISTCAGPVSVTTEGHRLRTSRVLYQFGSALENSHKVKFLDEFVVIGTQLVDKWALVDSSTGSERPIVMQLGNTWHVKNHERKCMHACSSIDDALLLWTWIIHNDYKCLMENEVDLTRWCSQFFPPVPVPKAAAAAAAEYEDVHDSGWD